MNRPESTNLTWQQLLAAFADGELDESARRRARAWLAEHPGAVAELRAQRALSPANVPFWETAAPARPDERAWAAVWNGIEAQLDRRPVPAPSPRLRAGWWKRGLVVALLAVPASAAAALVTLGLPEEPPARLADRQADEGSEEVFQVAGADDVKILSVREADANQLVVGEPPFNESMTLVSATDVRLEAMQPGWDADAKAGENSDAPMIVVPISRAP